MIEIYYVRYEVEKRTDRKQKENNMQVYLTEGKKHENDPVAACFRQQRQRKKRM